MALLPVVDRPAIQHVVEEAHRAGATEVFVVVRPDTAPLVHRHFAADAYLPGREGVQVQPVVQEHPRGLGRAVLTAEGAVEGRLIMCLLADNVAPPGVDALGPMVAEATDCSVVCAREVGAALLSSLGVIVPRSFAGLSRGRLRNLSVRRG